MQFTVAAYKPGLSPLPQDLWGNGERTGLWAATVNCRAHCYGITKKRKLNNINVALKAIVI